jgi:Sulfate permease family
MAVYALWGSSMMIMLGPVAIVSLMTGQIVTTYAPDFATNPANAVNVAAEVALACGIILTAMGLLNMGNFIRYISAPVMSGFTSGAACVIGITQMKGALGFESNVSTLSKIFTAPQTGMPGYEFNYQVLQWYMAHFNSKYSFTTQQMTGTSTAAKLYRMANGKNWRNPYAVKVHTYFLNFFCRLREEFTKVPLIQYPHHQLRLPLKPLCVCRFALGCTCPWCCLCT